MPRDVGQEYAEEFFRERPLWKRLKENGCDPFSGGMAIPRQYLSNPPSVLLTAKEKRAKRIKVNIPSE